MSKAILFIGHGSRSADAITETYSLAEQCRSAIPIDVQEVGFLEISTPTIKTAFETCVAKGATEIIVVPLLLMEAGHAKIDIPEQLSAYVTGNDENITIKYAKPFGIHDLMVTIVEDRVRSLDIPENVDRLILIGRGSSDPHLSKNFNKLISLVEKKELANKVEVCYLYGTEPSFKDVQWEVEKSSETVIFLPYLLFTGLLYEGIKRNLDNRDKRIHRTNYLFPHPNIIEIISLRVAEAKETTIAEKIK
ncbi:sirohydrochlorin chelatase [Bacillus seohaeanensis]|uniref:Sirohydrochlorin chelatase n=1 Tax=Bacillus seohaeanensis TaxID=284580 RepID=A0ABW5RU08_9BACI